MCMFHKCNDLKLRFSVRFLDTNGILHVKVASQRSKKSMDGVLCIAVKAGEPPAICNRDIL